MAQKKANRAVIAGPSTYCPFCGHKCQCIKSDQMTDALRHVRYQCTNANCGGLFLATIEMACIVIPSAYPNPAVSIPFADFGQLTTPAAKA